MDLLLLLLLSFLPKSGGLWTHLCCLFSSKAVVFGLTCAVLFLPKLCFMDALLLLLLYFLFKSGDLWTYLRCPFSSKAVFYGLSFMTFAVLSLQKL